VKEEGGVGCQKCKDPKITNFFISPDDISKNSFLCTDLCTETSSSSCYSQLPTVSERNADTDIIVAHTISEDKK
jgi:hypothetical protein